MLVKWYDTAKWLLERVDSFPKNQRFIFGTRIAKIAAVPDWFKQRRLWREINTGG